MPIANCYKYDDKIIPNRVHENEIKKNAKVRFYPDKTKVKIACWNKPMYLPEGYCKAEFNFFNKYEEEKNSVASGEATKIDKKAVEKPLKATSDKNRADSMRRAKNKIFEIAIANKWEYMLTFTLDSEKIDRYDPNAVLKSVGKWLDNQVQRNGLCYLIVPELHKDGAIHFHGLARGKLKMKKSGTYKIPGKKKPVKINTLTRRGLKPDDEGVKVVYNVNNFPYGFSTAVELDENAEKVAVYMTKYITKDLQKIFGSYYKAGGNIKRNMDFLLMDIDFIQMLTLDGCVTVDLPDNLGSVRYADCDSIKLCEFVPKVYDVVSDEGVAYYVDEQGEVCDERNCKDD